MKVTEQVETMLTPLLEEAGMELVDVRYLREGGRWVLRIFLDKPEGGMTLDDCAAVSEQLGRMLDAADIIPNAYVLEISSPGVQRVLKKEADFIRFRGQRAMLSVFAPIEGQRNFKGTIQVVESGVIRLADISGKVVPIPLSDIAKARLDPEIIL